jgi:hypothetical protein
MTREGIDDQGFEDQRKIALADLAVRAACAGRSRCRNA